MNTEFGKRTVAETHPRPAIEIVVGVEAGTAGICVDLVTHETTLAEEGVHEHAIRRDPSQGLKTNIQGGTVGSAHVAGICDDPLPTLTTAAITDLDKGHEVTPGIDGDRGVTKEVPGKDREVTVGLVTEGPDQEAEDRGNVELVVGLIYREGRDLVVLWLQQLVQDHGDS